MKIKVTQTLQTPQPALTTVSDTTESDETANNRNNSDPEPSVHLSLDRPRIHTMDNNRFQGGHSHPAPEAASGGFSSKADYEEYFMSVNQHKKSLR